MQTSAELKAACHSLVVSAKHSGEGDAAALGRLTEALCRFCGAKDVEAAVESLLGQCDIFLDKLERFGENRRTVALASAGAAPTSKPQSDNADTPFVPRLRSKPHSIVPLSRELLAAQLNPSALPANIEFEHPYLAEIAAAVGRDFAAARELIDARCSLIFDGNFAFVDSESAFEAMLERLSESAVIAVDVEAHNERSFQGIVCLIQISIPGFDWIIDALALAPRLERLNEVFCDPKITKLFHGGNSDVKWLQRDFGVYVVNLLDTFVIGKAAAPNAASHSFASLVYSYLGVVVDKRYQRADWRQRPLSGEMLQYARADSHLLLPLFGALLDALNERAAAELTSVERLFAAVRDDCRAVALKRYAKPSVLGKAYAQQLRQLDWASQRQRERFLAFWIARDAYARQTDLSLTAVCPNAVLAELCTAPDFEAAVAERRLDADFIAALRRERESEHCETVLAEKGAAIGGLKAKLIKASSNGLEAINKPTPSVAYRHSLPQIVFAATIQTLIALPISTSLALPELPVFARSQTKSEGKGAAASAAPQIDEEAIVFEPQMAAPKPVQKEDLLRNVLGLSISEGHKRRLLGTVERKYREEQMEAASEAMSNTRLAKRTNSTVMSFDDRPSIKRRR